MSRYFTKPRPIKAWIADEVWDEPMTHMPTVSDHEATDTGLLDSDGNTIWRAPNPIGFVWGDA
ncbi:hypothetical protein [Novosphingobium sp. Leaf2]|uniref:hypothetical protein n=1 Tax=Novosphingobium sp. Leaf2 TaxID=1735670 RepID=UPI00070214D1|nr:hypothetical protein [Novosphingobium sp. Leaf2]KQM18371.1 hypothetical protein ASE49_09170 [Novosphingobium sp. Leaf2]